MNAHPTGASKGANAAMHDPYPPGTPGQPWGDAEKVRWRQGLRKQRSYSEDVLTRIEALRGTLDVTRYGQLDYPPDGRFSLHAIASRDWDERRPLALVTGGVHGYETSGVRGALEFVEQRLGEYLGRVDVLVVACVSPWAYERIQRWNPFALDPNRSFIGAGQTPEAAALTRLIAPIRERFTMHIDLHETTDSDESEFRPALAARDGLVFEPGIVPDGFYLVDDSQHPCPAFQEAVIAAVEKVTHIAPADARGQIIGSPVVARGVIGYPLRELGLCAGLSAARYRTTTEVYPDSPQASPEQCDRAQAAAVCAALDYVLALPDRGRDR